MREGDCDAQRDPYSGAEQRLTPVINRALRSPRHPLADPRLSEQGGAVLNRHQRRYGHGGRRELVQKPRKQQTGAEYFPGCREKQTVENDGGKVRLQDCCAAVAIRRSGIPIDVKSPSRGGEKSA
jgi:hypothetical protein